MFNYYRRIAEYASELERDGNIKKAKQLREILSNEKLCIFCGNATMYDGEVKSCCKCILKNKDNGREGNS